MSLIQIENEQTRRDVLMLLQEDADYSINNLVLAQALSAIGNPIAKDRLTQQLHWLQDQGLVTLEPIGSMVLVKLTALGSDVALSRVSVPAIARMSLN